VIGRKRKDPVTPETARTVLLRDGMCIRTLLGDDHECRDAFGTPHRPDDLDRLTLDHVHDGGGMMGRRAKSDPAHLVAVDFGSHLGGWSTAKVNRERVRAYLERVA